MQYIIPYIEDTKEICGKGKAEGEFLFVNIYIRNQISWGKIFWQLYNS